MSEQRQPVRARRALTPEEYRARAYRRTPRWQLALGLVVVLAIGLAVALVGYRNFGRNPIVPTVTAYSVTDHGIRATVSVHRSHADRAVTCVLRARDRSGAVLTRTTVHLPPGRATVTIVRTLPTRTRPTVAEVESCAYDR